MQQSGIKQIALIPTHMRHDTMSCAEGTGDCQDHHVVGMGEQANKPVTFKTMHDHADAAVVRNVMTCNAFLALGAACSLPEWLGAGSVKRSELERRGATFHPLTDEDVTAILMTTVPGTSIEALVRRATDGCDKALERLARTAGGQEISCVDFDHCFAPSLVARKADPSRSQNDPHVPDFDNCPCVGQMRPSALIMWRFVYTLFVDNTTFQDTLFAGDPALVTATHTLLGVAGRADFESRTPYYDYRSRCCKIAAPAEWVAKAGEILLEDAAAGGALPRRARLVRAAWAGLIRAVARVADICDRPHTLFYMCDAKTANFLA